MDTDLLKTFIEVHQTGHFGRAAENLFLTQAAVSARIKQLENNLGGPLFSRYRNNLQLTESGQRLVPHAQAMLVAWERARQDVCLSSSNSVALSLGATGDLWDLFLQELVQDCFTQRADIRLRAEAHSPEVLLRKLNERSLDIAFVYEPAKHSDIQSVLLNDIDLILVKNNRNSSTAEHLERLIHIDWGSSFTINFAQHFGNVPALLHTSIARLALHFLSHQDACAYLPRKMVEPLTANCLEVVNNAPILSRSIFACFHVDHKNENDIDQLVAFAKKQLGPN